MAAYFALYCALVGFAALAAIAYPFRPFKSRPIAAFSAVFWLGMFVVVVPKDEPTTPITRPAPTVATVQPILAVQQIPPAPMAKGRQGAYVGDNIPVSSDLRADYEVVEISGKTAGRVKVLSKRTGPSGTSYSRRECDCVGNAFRYLGDGATLAAMRASLPEKTMTRLTAGSVSSHVCEFACVYYRP